MRNLNYFAALNIVLTMILKSKKKYIYFNLPKPTTICFFPLKIFEKNTEQDIEFFVEKKQKLKSAELFSNRRLKSFQIIMPNHILPFDSN